MSIKVCGILELNDINISKQEQKKISFFVAEQATSHHIGINFNENIWIGFMDIIAGMTGVMPFELTDYPMDVNAQDLFFGWEQGSFQGTLFYRMKKVQDFLTKVLNSNLIQSIALYTDVIDMEADNIETLQTNVENFNQFMIDLYDRENNWTPTVKIIIRKS